MYSEGDITWSSIERYYSYKKVNWTMNKEDIPRYILIDENDKKIDINVNNV